MFQSESESVESSDDISSSTKLPRTCLGIRSLITLLGVVDATSCSIIVAADSSIAVTTV